MQQINLYLPEFQPNREPLRSMHMVWGMAIFVVLLAIASVLSVNANRQRSLVLEQNKAQLEQLKAKLAQLGQQRPQSNLAELDTQIVQFEQELERRKQIYIVIANKNLGNNSGFSAHLQALGRQSLDSISLSVFSLQRGGNYAEFAGKTRSAEQIPLYIQRLRAEPVFAQSAFGVLNVTPANNASGLFDFSLARPTAEADVMPAAKTAVQMLLDANARARGAD